MKSIPKLLILVSVLLGCSASFAAGPVAAKPPQAMVHSITAFGDRAGRAELIVDGRVITVKEGDELLGWTISSISDAAVVVSKTVLQADPLTNKGTRMGSAQAARESASWFAPVRSSNAPGRLVEFTQTFKLPSAIDSSSAGSTRGPMSAISIQ